MKSSRIIESEQRQLLGRQQTSYCYKKEDKVIVVHNEKAFLLQKKRTTTDVVQFQSEELNRCIPTDLVTTFKEVYGITQLSVKLYLILVTESEQVGEIKGKAIFKVNKVDFLQIGCQKKQQPLLAAFKDSFKILNLYYSEQDLTQRLQFSHIYPQYYPYSFFCNYRHTLKHSNFPSHLLTKFIFGFAETKRIAVEGVVYQLTLISRGNFNSASRRWLRRGLNQEGHPANNFETELILEIQTKDKHSIYSMMQTRGSVPLLWSQTPNFSLTSPFRISSNARRITQQLGQYIQQCERVEKKMLLLSLINKTGRQGMLGQLFEMYFRDINKPTINSIWFDYNSEYRQHKQACFNRLIELIRHDLSDFGYFKIEKRPNDYSYEVIKSQSGVIRTNCIDCIDRTNIVQSLIAKLALLAFIDNHQQKESIIFFPLEKCQIPELQNAFKQLWKNNAAAIGYQLTGASAMKMDFYENGQRSVFGPLRDLGVGAKRYYFGTLVDYYYQNCLDLHFGKLNPEEHATNLKGGWKFLGLLTSLAAIAGLSFVAFKVVQSHFKDQVKKISYGVSASVLTTLLGLISIKCNSEYFIEKPILRLEHL